MSEAVDGRAGRVLPILTRGAALCAAALVALVLTLSAVFGQVDRDQYAEWENLATRAEEVLSAERASDDALEELRASLAQWRETFLNGENVNAARIDTLQSQLDSLGPAPDDGSRETDNLAQRRSELEEQLAAAQAPVRRAEEAYIRADGLIREIDEIIRTRQADELLRIGPSPLIPQLWPQAAEEALGALNNLWTEMRRNAGSELVLTSLRSNLPVILLLVAVALVLVMRGPIWVRRAGDRLRHWARRGTGVWRFLVSLGLILVPLAGLIALTSAAYLTELAGANGQTILLMVPIWGGVLLFIRWLADRSFNQDDAVATLPLGPARRTEAWVYSSFLALLFVLRSVGETFAKIYEFSEDTRVVLDFPVLVLCSLVLFRLGQILAGVVAEAAQDGDDHPATATDEHGTLLTGAYFRLRLTRLVGQACMGIAVVGPAMAVIGYVMAGDALVYPAIETLALMALVLVLQRFINDLYELVTGRNADESNSLITVLAGFALMLGALPLLALTWGARPADLTELWAHFREGLVLGDTRISPTSFLAMIAIFALGYALTRLLQSGLRNSILPRTRMDLGGQNAVVTGLGYIGVILAALAAITAAGIDLTALGYVAGALSVGIGFGLQNIVSNFVSGIILLVERPISEGDWIEVGPNMGIVKDISVRSTRIETFSRTDVIVPNSDFVSGTVTNYTRGNTIGRVFIEVGVAYGTDTQKVHDILLSITRQHRLVMLNPAPMVTFARFGADALEFEIRAIITDVNEVLIVTSEFNHEIARRFQEEGIEIPFAQRDIWLRNPETLRQRPERSGQEPFARAADGRGKGDDRVARDPEQYDDGAGDGEGE
ncbi:DUF3772 domain-containing protein [Salipiger mucosus]|uniref:Potassium efflux system KefA protein / Small-conductance mechanosensitive channel n=1 Tax=Salipiger mucosus DSM 16094 TaxID=1123237 RepID=S9QAR0_9RHOB|nr:DUF3772 domain-containing protein [Salipiger mucosus]EPX78461.1 Potassium efflux system KefA protein / Small-conductance mechanosensitive channel [Salipiger mucosus DSM 16094]